MVKVQEATFTPGSDGGELRANLQIGRQELTASWAIGQDDEDLKALLDRLTVKVQQVSFLDGSNGGEIRAQLTVGDRVFVSRLTVGSDDGDLQPLLQRLLDEIGRKFLDNLQAALKAPGG